MKPETYFLKYAFPCAQVLLDRKKIDKAAYDKLNEYFLQDDAPSREVLEAIFSSAFRRIKKLAEEMQKDYWDIEVLRRYFVKDHNKSVDMGEGDYEYFGESFREVCKVYVADVLEINGRILTVKYNNSVQKVLGDIVDAKVGDRVTIHLGFAIEVL